MCLCVYLSLLRYYTPHTHAHTQTHTHTSCVKRYSRALPLRGFGSCSASHDHNEHTYKPSHLQHSPLSYSFPRRPHHTHTQTDRQTVWSGVHARKGKFSHFLPPSLPHSLPLLRFCRTFDSSGQLRLAPSCSRTKDSLSRSRGSPCCCCCGVGGCLLENLSPPTQPILFCPVQHDEACTVLCVCVFCFAMSCGFFLLCVVHLPSRLVLSSWVGGGMLGDVAVVAQSGG